MPASSKSAPSYAIYAPVQEILRLLVDAQVAAVQFGDENITTEAMYSPNKQTLVTTLSKALKLAKALE